MEAVFAEATAEELLVDDGWKLVDVEPEAVEVQGNGNGANGNGHAAIGIGPTVELVPGNGNGANSNGNGRHDEVPEPPPPLFSWAEFMAESPAKPNGMPKPSSLSLFEWAFSLKQEKELVSAGR